MPRFTLNVNGKTHRVNVDADTPLLWVLRDELNYTGTKFGCGRGFAAHVLSTLMARQRGLA